MKILGDRKDFSKAERKWESFLEATYGMNTPTEEEKGCDIGGHRRGHNVKCSLL